MDRAPISVMELNELHWKTEEQQRKINNSEMRGIAWARLEEELRQLKLEVQMLNDQVRKTKRLLVKAGNQRESCKRQFETLNRELEEAKKKAENKTRDCVTLEDERKC